ncbi:hypothetical protein NP493_589g01027 [Ridgeia piscesae]|uniref:Uncharacterized protein n=1 Tax=Ridgeia piscesae TaxID=27915 RepID=A0AAD9KU90_RIDPI|nr:hypothetical protein NP493_589g01027 [Ridgeia piscesae]
MTCSEARDIIGAVSIHNDKLKVLDSLKRYLVDFQTRAGREYITSSYIYEPDKFRAMGILNTVRSDVADMVPAGGHQGYAALGGLYIQAAPLNRHIYGDIHSQLMNLPGHGQVNLPALARAAQLPSMYRGHPSYAYPQGRDYAEDRNYPCHDRYIESAMARRFPSSMQYTQGI